MTDLDDIPGLFIPTTEPVVSTSTKKCKKHQWRVSTTTMEHECKHCGRPYDEALVRQNKNNRSRGNREELTVARAIGGRKVGPLGHPWDVEVPGYCRLQVKKLKTPPSLRAIGKSLVFGTGDMFAGYVWVEPGRGGEQLIVLRFKEFTDRYGVPAPEVDE